MKTLVVYVPGRNNYIFDFIPKYQGEKVNLIESDKENKLLNLKLYQDKMEFARQIGCDTLSIVGYGEPLLNQSFLESINMLNKQLKNPFVNIELKTNGSCLSNESESHKISEEDNTNKAFKFLSNTDVKTVVVYLTAFEDFKHHQFMTDGIGDFKLTISLLCEEIKKHGYNLRLEIFLTKWLDHMTLQDITNHCLTFNPDQVTLKKMLRVEAGSDVDEWIKRNECNSVTIDRIQEGLSQTKLIGQTSSGYDIYSFKNISFVLNDGSHKDDNFNNVYLLPNARLYRQPDDLGSLIF